MNHTVHFFHLKSIMFLQKETSYFFPDWFLFHVHVEKINHQGNQEIQFEQYDSCQLSVCNCCLSWGFLCIHKQDWTKGKKKKRDCFCSQLTGHHSVRSSGRAILWSTCLGHSLFRKQRHTMTNCRTKCRQIQWRWGAGVRLALNPGLGKVVQPKMVKGNVVLRSCRTRSDAIQGKVFLQCGFLWRTKGTVLHRNKNHCAHHWSQKISGFSCSWSVVLLPLHQHCCDHKLRNAPLIIYLMSQKLQKLDSLPNCGIHALTALFYWKLVLMKRRFLTCGNFNAN